MNTYRQHIWRFPACLYSPIERTRRMDSSVEISDEQAPEKGNKGHFTIRAEQMTTTENTVTMWTEMKSFGSPFVLHRL